MPYEGLPINYNGIHTEVEIQIESLEDEYEVMGIDDLSLSEFKSFLEHEFDVGDNDTLFYIPILATDVIYIDKNKFLKRIISAANKKEIILDKDYLDEIKNWNKDN